MVRDAKNAALGYMRDRGVHAYVAGGVRFTFTPGVDKVGCKRVKDAGDNRVTPPSDAGEPEESDDDSGEGHAEEPF